MGLLKLHSLVKYLKHFFHEKKKKKKSMIIRQISCSKSLLSSLGPSRLWATVPKSVAEEGGVDESATVAA